MLDKKYNALETEKKWKEYWDQEKIYKFDPNSDKEIFSVDTPPPTVSGAIHPGHAFSYSQAEMIVRHQRKSGKNIFYPFGFDDNGLPTERLVEKEKNVRAKDMPREEFRKLCLDTVAGYEKDFVELFKSLGFSSDFDLLYTSIGPEARRISQRSFIELAKSKEAYHSEMPSMWCTECETSIAQADLENATLKSTFNFITFKTEGEDLEIATTRPEFLPACVAIFIHPEDEKHQHLVGKEAIVPIFDFKVPIIADDKVEKEKGSGVVMCCTFGDQTDIEWWKKYQLPLKEIITDDGKIKEEIPHIGGMKIKAARKQVIELLNEKGLLNKQEDIEHDVSVHERCGLEVELKTKKQWLIHTMKHKKEFIEMGNKIKWHPAYMEARYKDWVENLFCDWGISRQRYFGVPFPVWYCKDCGEPVFAEDSDLPVDPLATNPEKPCSKCGSTSFDPETDVMDTWATSSTTQLLNMKWKEQESLVDKLSPMSLRPNAHDIIRTWDFYSIVKNYYHLKEIPWKNLMISGFITDEKGKKFSKSKGNSKYSTEEIVELYSADVVRYFASQGKLGTDLRFNDDYFKIGKKLINKLFNASKFVLMHLEDYDPANDFNNYAKTDKWILNEYSKMSTSFYRALDNYEVGPALTVLEKFFWNFCDNYIEIIKHSLYRPEEFSENRRLSGQKTAYTILLGLLDKFSVFFPFITEEIYSAYFKEKEGYKSIHIKEYNKEEYNFETIGDKILDLITEVRKEKTLNNVSLKTEISSLDLIGSDEIKEQLKPYLEDFKATLNIKNINFIHGETLKIENIAFKEEA